MQDVLAALGIKAANSGASTGTQWIAGGGKELASWSPVDGKEIARVTLANEEAYEQVIKKAQEAFVEWRMYPSPKRGDIVRQVGEALRKHKEPLGRLVSYEMGKSLQEGLGEVQEMI